MFNPFQPGPRRPGPIITPAAGVAAGTGSARETLPPMTPTPIDPTDPGHGPGAAEPTPPGPVITPGLIVSSLSTSRLADVARLLGTPVDTLFVTPPRSPGGEGREGMSVRMLALLHDNELRALARIVHVPDDGHFVDLFRRLSMLC